VVGAKHKNEHREEISFGEQLQSLRLQKGLELKAVSAETKIAMGTLLLLESSAFDKLPDVVFVTGFIRAYAKAVDASPDVLVQNYLAGRHHYLQTLQFEADLLRKRKKFWPRLFWTLFLLAGIYAVFVIFLRNQEEPPKVLTPVAEPVASPEPPAEAPPQEAAETPPVGSAPEQGYTLSVNATEATWIKVIIDGQSPKQYTLNPGDELELKAASGYNLLMGSASALTLKLNGKSVPLEGRKGQSVTLKLP
jgi:cytoskeleton protein RodZ